MALSLLVINWEPQTRSFRPNTKWGSETKKMWKVRYSIPPTVIIRTTTYRFNTWSCNDSDHENRKSSMGSRRRIWLRVVTIHYSSINNLWISFIFILYCFRIISQQHWLELQRSSSNILMISRQLSPSRKDSSYWKQISIICVTSNLNYSNLTWRLARSPVHNHPKYPDTEQKDLGSWSILFQF